MTDWLLPNEDELFIGGVLQELKDRDFDSASLFLNLPSAGLVTGMMRYVRASNKFQEWNGSAWVDKVLSLAGGGTNAATATDARTSLGLGTIAIQDANNVDITGGNLAGSGTGITNLNASSLASGTVPDARFPATLPAIGGVNLTSLNATNLTTGTVPNARFPATLPALNGSLLTALNASALATGTVNQARLGSGGGGAVKFLREDNTWQDITVVKSVTPINIVSGTIPGSGSLDFSVLALTDSTKAVFVPGGPLIYTRSDGSVHALQVRVHDNNNLRVYNTSIDNYTLDAGGVGRRLVGVVIEYK